MRLRYLLDEMYGPKLAQLLRRRRVDTIAVKEYAELTGASDTLVLYLAALDRRVVVTENVADFAFEDRRQEHNGIVLCTGRKWPRTPEGLERLCAALVELAAHPPSGLGHHPMTFWLQPPPV